DSTVQSQARYLLLVGVQGSGKGTQAKVLVNKLGIPHVSTGDLFREMKTLDTPLAREIQAVMNSGKLISDEITLKVVRERLSRPDAKNGVILDGFPRTQPQAEGLDELLKEFGAQVTRVLYLKLDDAEAIDRIVTRRLCSKNPDHVFNVKSKPPKVAGVCDIDGAPLIQRPDDTEEKAQKRIADFHSETEPLLVRYGKRGAVCEVKADQSVERVSADLLACLGM
ncbi:MAG TPA: nucleoside monophosphate kinase, partial [Aggregatilineales bacterium]|nr:nucleoside monophosphate kinase [Aggregatilineales bacterium]